MTTSAIHRTTARVVPVNAEGQVLLLRGHDPARPSEPHWFTIGGGAEPGETVEQAAVRELREETGIRLSADELGEPFYQGRHDYTYNGVEYTAQSTFFAVSMGNPHVVFDGIEDGEVITGARWWNPADLVDVAVSHPQLPKLMRLAVEHARS